MPETTKAAKITCEVHKSIAPRVQTTLAEMRLERAQVQSRRLVVLREHAPLHFLPPTTRLDEDPAEVFELYVPRESARGALLALARGLDLFTPGRGAIYAEDVELLAPPGLDPRSARVEADERSERQGERLAPLALVNCVVQRGSGNDIARRVLEGGACVPSIAFGIGTGVRNRLGLLRIAIPAEKEIVSLLVDAQDQDDTLATFIEAGRLDQPGRGFVGAYRVPFGVANPSSFRGRQTHGATMEQVIAAIDELKSGAQWRRRSAVADAGSPARRPWLHDLVNVTLNCNEGSSERLVTAAMAAGAGGATISKARLFSPLDSAFPASPARELIDFGIGADQLRSVVEALREQGAFAADTACVVETKPLPKAFTYSPG